MEIVKSGGRCYDGLGWNFCPFWKRDSNYLHDNRCNLFGGEEGVKKWASEPLVICNRIYGKNYHGKV